MQKTGAASARGSLPETLSSVPHGMNTHASRDDMMQASWPGRWRRTHKGRLVASAREQPAKGRREKDGREGEREREGER